MLSLLMLLLSLPSPRAYAPRWKIRSSPRSGLSGAWPVWQPARTKWRAALWPKVLLCTLDFIVERRPVLVGRPSRPVHARPLPDFCPDGRAPEAWRWSGIRLGMGRRWEQYHSAPRRRFHFRGRSPKALRTAKPEEANCRRNERRHPAVHSQSPNAIDTNVVVRLIVRDDPRKTASAEAFSTSI